MSMVSTQVTLLNNSGMAKNYTSCDQFENLHSSTAYATPEQNKGKKHKNERSWNSYQWSHWERE